MNKTVVYSARVASKVKSSTGNYEVGKLQVGDATRVPTIGDRFSSKHCANHCCTLIKIRNSGKKPYTIEWDDGRKVHCDISWLTDMNFLEEKGEVSAKCSNTPASLQESPALNSELKQPELLTSSRQNSSLKTTLTLKQSSDIDIQKSPSTATSETITLSQDNSTYTQLDFLVLEPAPQETVQDLITQNHHSGLNHCDVLQMAAPVSSSLKILKGLSIEDYERFLADCEWSAITGMIRNSYRQRKSERHTKETDSSSLPTPTTYCKGSTGCRPAGQTRLEQKLKPYLTKGDKLNPALPGWMMGFPAGWTERVLMDGGVTISVQLPFTPEYVTTQINAENVTTSTPVQSAHCKPRSQLNESVTSPILPQQLKAITLHQPWAYLVGRYKWFETRSWPTNYRGKIAIHAAKRQKDTDYWCNLLQDLLPPVEELVFGAVVAIADLTDCILMTEEFISQQSPTELRFGNWKVGHYAWKLENMQILPEPIPAKGKQKLWDIELPFALAQPAPGIAPQSLITKSSEEKPSTQEALILCPSCNSQHIYLSEGCGICGLEPDMQRTQELQVSDRTETFEQDNAVSEPTPVNFLEESREAPRSAQQPKRRQRKGCLYKYLENKKLKNGSIVSYPRIIEDKRDPDNPQHWRWGFNWEEKIDGEWKGRSIGSVPVGAISMIQSMQNEGIPLQEIIGFIKRAKAKK